ncbi:MAG: hypothetical protein NTZ20_05365 [Candidatus Levybacteria bacterium]|nr:hypothetical protein [Candidatus Levybacteria bacterium]
MIINTKYNIGDKFWVARVYEENKKETIVINGKTYIREYKEYSPAAKQKTIIGISIDVESHLAKIKNINVSYTITVSNAHFIGLHDYISSSRNETMFSTELEALKYASDKLYIKKESFHGEKTTEWEN